MSDGHGQRQDAHVWYMTSYWKLLTDATVLSFAFKRHWNGPQTQRLETYPAVEVPANCPSLVWFLAPHVELCNQQYRYLRSGLPAIKAKLLVGSDNVDKWKEKRTWDAALDQVRLVISTPQILEDALTHGFVGLEAICLMVFDEGQFAPLPSDRRRRPCLTEARSTSLRSQAPGQPDHAEVLPPAQKGLWKWLGAVHLGTDSQPHQHKDQATKMSAGPT